MRATLALFPVLCFLGCGGGIRTEHAVSVTVAPAQATVKAGGTIALVATGTNFQYPPIVRWWITESKAIDFNNDCGKLDTESKSFTGCPDGFVMQHSVEGNPNAAVYYAPAAAGTYHVTAEMTEVCCWFDILSRSGQAEITVTP